MAVHKSVKHGQNYLALSAPVAHGSNLYIDLNKHIHDEAPLGNASN